MITLNRKVILIVNLFALSTVHAEHTQLPDLTVSQTQADNFSVFKSESHSTSQPAVDAASLIRRIPGGSLNYNGGLSGQMQYRGMYGPRMNVRIDGAYIESGGPNWMDPPLHYLPVNLIESLKVYRGIPSVSSGSGIGGYVEAEAKKSKFTDSKEFKNFADLSASAYQVNDAYNYGGLVGVSNQNHRIHLLGNSDRGNDTEFNGGVVRGTEYDRSQAGFGYGYKNTMNEFSLDMRHTNTDHSGTPTLPLDIAFFKTNQINTGFNTRMGGFDIESKLFLTDVRHQMDNFTLRPAPNFSDAGLAAFTDDDKRIVDADSEGYGWSFVAARKLLSGELRLGTDGRVSQHNATVTDPDFAAFFITNFNDASTEQFGFYTEWLGRITEHLTLEAGIRIEQVYTDAGFVNAFPANLADGGNTMMIPVATQTLRDDFNSSDLSQSDTNLDAVVKFTALVSNHVSVELGLSRKTRSPYYNERYLWIPLEVNSGLGDGNNYIGSPGLKPEKSHQIEIGLNYDAEKIYFSPRAYYRTIDDYIQGIALTSTDNAAAVTFSTMAAGDASPLQFANVDAELYGFDAAYGYLLNRHWRIDGVLFYTRGKRRDTHDNLYRIAPLNTRLSISYSSQNWSATLEGLAFAEQDNIANEIAGSTNSTNPTNNNNPTSGYALLNLNGQYHFDTGIKLYAGVENVLDKRYTDHLTGFNRNASSDIAVGQRLRGAGRNAFIRFNYLW